MLMNVNIDYDGELERKNTDLRLFPNPDKEKPFISTIWPTSTIGRSKTPNRRMSVLGVGNLQTWLGGWAFPYWTKS